MIKDFNLEVSYESKLAGKTRVLKFEKIDPLEVSKVLEAIREGQRIREVEGPKFYGVTSGC